MGYIRGNIKIAATYGGVSQSAPSVLVARRMRISMKEHGPPRPRRGNFTRPRGRPWKKSLDENPWRDASQCAEFALLSGRGKRTAAGAGSKSQNRESFRAKFAKPRKYGTTQAKEGIKREREACGSFLPYIIF